MVTTSVASPLVAHPLVVNDDPRAKTSTLERPQPVRPVACSILTPSGALLARAKVKPRPNSMPADAYALEVSEVEPQGALEPLLRSNPQVVLRMPEQAQLAMRIDHILGPRQQRTYYLQTLSAERG